MTSTIRGRMVLSLLLILFLFLLISVSLFLCQRKGTSKWWQACNNFTSLNITGNKINSCPLVLLINCSPFSSCHPRPGGHLQLNVCHLYKQQRKTHNETLSDSEVYLDWHRLVVAGVSGRRRPHRLRPTPLLPPSLLLLPQSPPRPLPNAAPSPNLAS